MLSKKEPKKELKKDHTNIIICPRCGAGNLTIQSSCGKCGLVFPKDKAKYKGKKGELPGNESVRTPSIPPSLPGAPEERVEQEEGGENGTGEEAEPQPPQRPKHLPEKGATEGISKEASRALSCPRCGMDVKADVKRCPHCGYKR